MTRLSEKAIVLAESPLDLDSAIALQRAYLDACQALLDDSDYASIRGEKFRKRTGWSKLRRAFAVSCEILRENRLEEEGDWGYLFTVRAQLPTGRIEDGDGSCMASELKRGSIAATVHNVRAKALTRAKNRATSDILGAGIVSAEEMGNNENNRHWIDRPEVRKRFWALSKGTLKLIEDDVYTALGVAHIHEFTGTMRDAKALLEEYARDKGQQVETET